MADDQYVRVRRNDLHHLIQHCSNCSHLSDNERNAVTSVRTADAITPQKRNQPSESECDDTHKRQKCRISLPKANTWGKLQKSKIGSQKNYENFVRSLTQHHTVKVEEEHGSSPSTLGNEFVRLGVKLATLVKSSESVAGQQRALVSLQGIVLRSYCKYLEFKGYPRTEVIQKMSFSCREKSILSQIDKILLVNSAIAAIATLEGYDVPRGTEVFALCPLPLRTIEKFTANDVEDIRSQVSNAKQDFRKCLKPGYTIPGLIFQLLVENNVEGPFSLEEISLCLGYDPKTIPSPEDLFEIKAAQILLPTEFVQCFPVSDQALRSCSDTTSERSLTIVSTQEPYTQSVASSFEALSEDRYVAVCLLSLLHHFTSAGASIKRSLLSGLRGFKRRWNSMGELVDIDAGCLGFDHTTLSLIRDEERLDDVLNRLKSMGLVHWTQDEEDPILVSTNTTTAMQEALEKRSDWKQAMILISFFFAGCEYSKFYRQEGCTALPAFSALLERHGDKIDPVLSKIVVPALLQASKFSTQQWKQTAIERVESIGVHHLPTHVKAYFAYRKSLVLRTNRREQDAKQAILTYLAANHTPKDARLNAIHGFVYHSLGWLAIEAGFFDEAFERTNSWKPLEQEPSVYELRVLSRLQTLKGIIKSHQRDYQVALWYFDMVITSYDLSSRVRQSVIAKAIDACCESTQYGRARQFASEEFKRWNLDPTEISMAHFDDHYLREILISNAELHVRLNEHEQAERVLLPLIQCFDHRPLDVQVDQQRHIRVLILYAQNLHMHASAITQWEKAHDAWFRVVNTAKEYTVLDASGWDFGLICLSIHHTQKEIGLDEGEDWYGRATATFAIGVHFWWCGMQTYWLPYILDHIRSVPLVTREGLAPSGPRQSSVAGEAARIFAGPSTTRRKSKASLSSVELDSVRAS